MHFTGTLALFVIAAFALGTGGAAGVFHVRDSSRDAATSYHQAWNDLIEITPMCKAIQEGNAKNVLLILEAKAEGTILRLAPSIGRAPVSQDKIDFVASVGKFAEYRTRFARPSDLPPRTRDVDAAIESICRTHR